MLINAASSRHHVGVLPCRNYLRHAAARGQRRKRASEELLPYPRSETAEPPITYAEARMSTDAVCRFHKGLISTDRHVLEGSVNFCPVGRQYWRYFKQVAGMFRPLRYPKTRYT